MHSLRLPFDEGLGPWICTLMAGREWRIHWCWAHRRRGCCWAVWCWLRLQWYTRSNLRYWKRLHWLCWLAGGVFAIVFQICDQPLPMSGTEPQDVEKCVSTSLFVTLTLTFARTSPLCRYAVSCPSPGEGLSSFDTMVDLAWHTAPSLGSIEPLSQVRQSSLMSEENCTTTVQNAQSRKTPCESKRTHSVCLCLEDVRFVEDGICVLTCGLDLWRKGKLLQASLGRCSIQSSPKNQWKLKKAKRRYARRWLRQILTLLLLKLGAQPFSMSATTNKHTINNALCLGIHKLLLNDWTYQCMARLERPSKHHGHDNNCTLLLWTSDEQSLAERLSGHSNKSARHLPRDPILRGRPLWHVNATSS